MKKERLHEFNGSQDDLYATGNRAWNLYGKHQPEFLKLNGIYTKELGVQNLADIEAAKKLPGISVRRATPKELRKRLSPAADTCLSVSLMLFSGIEKVFGEEEWETEKQKAGAGNYSAAAKYKWRKVSALMAAGSEYLAENWERLQNGGKGLPAGFQQAFNDAQTVFDDGYSKFGSSQTDFTDQTTEKADANNAIYRALMNMLNDGKIIYRKNARARRQFSYSNILATITSGGKTGFIFELRAEGSLDPVSTASVLLQPVQKSATVGADGNVIIETKEGTYSYTVTAPGCATAEGTAIASANILRRVKLILKKAAGESATA